MPDAEGEALVLAAVDVPCRLVPGRERVGLFVHSGDVERALYELSEYRRENRARPLPALRPASEGVDAALVAAALLVVAHVAAMRQLFGIDWVDIGYAGAGLIRDGQWWRAVTALSLHADFGHLASNVVAGALIGVLLAQVLGPGLTWLAIIVAGGLGNGLNALLQPAAHASIGASTAVFAALGMLSALMWRRALPLWRRGLRRWVPLAAGVALLAMLGTGGERTDLGGHAFGFVVGVAAGTGLHLAAERIPKRKGAQIAYGAAALALWVATWALAVANA